jgi:hypothetical protein
MTYRDSLPRVLKEEHHQHDNHADREADFWETAYPNSDTRNNGGGRHQCDCPDNDDLVVRANRYIFVEIVQSWELG